MKSTIRALNKDKCTGCGACGAVCPVEAIQFIKDKEGFYYPSIVEKKCVKCGKCYAICPQINYKKKNIEKQRCLAVMASDEIRRNSSSGGAFSLFAEYILKQGGVVCGAAWDGIKVEHIIIDQIKDLYKLRKSKYIQSNTKNIYVVIKELLERNILVFFTGCPCQVAALNHFLGKEYENLLTADIICHGVPSEDALKCYIVGKYNESEDVDIDFRDKSVYKWSTTFLLKHGNQDVFREGYDESNWWKAYRTGLMYRESCYQCKYANINREGDLTIGDFWGISQFSQELNDYNGTSVLLLNTPKADTFLGKINELEKMNIKKVEDVPIEFAIKNNGNLAYPSPRNDERNYFYHFMKTVGFDNALEKVKTRVDERYNVGILGYWYATNYGSVLTYYALALIIERLGYSVMLIDEPEKERDAEGLDVFSRRFLEGRVNISRSVKWNDLDKINEMCDIFMVGSDQIWTPGAIRHMGYFFFLKTISDAKKKIAYAPSFGQSTFKALPETIKTVQFYLNKFDAISVREQDGIKICDEMFKIKADRVLDPVFLIDRKDYDDIAEESIINLSHDYIIAYILDPTEDKRKALKLISENLKMPFVVMLDGRFNTFEKNKERMQTDNIVENVNVNDWVYYIKHAKYMFTDSHHGLAMGIIYNLQCICYANQSRGQSRFTSLLNVLGLSDRLIFSSDEILKKEILKKDINYKQVNSVLYKEKYKSISWLIAALEKEKKQGPSDYEMAVRVAKEEFEKQLQGIQRRLDLLENR